MPTERDIRKRVGHLLWTRHCEVCAVKFTQPRAGRPRKYCKTCARVNPWRGRAAVPDVVADLLHDDTEVA